MQVILFASIARTDIALTYVEFLGSGSILESLRLHKKLIVVVNKKLLDNHQDELANVLEGQGCLIKSTSRYIDIGGGQRWQFWSVR